MKPFRNLAKKLHSSAGASIVLALLLFLVCALAGAAAVTAASANVGRYTYQQDSQQAYLAVSSAARLIRDQLDGLEAQTCYEYNVTESDFTIVPEWDSTHALHVGHSLELTGGTLTKPIDPVGYTFKRGEAELVAGEGDILAFLRGDLSEILKNAFYTYVEGYSGPTELWKNNVDTANKPLVPTFTGEYELKINCDGFNEVTVTIQIDRACEDYRDGQEKKVKVTVKCDSTVYKMTGKVKVAVRPEDGTVEKVTLLCSETVTNPDGTIASNEIPVSENLVCSSKIFVTVKFDFSDAVLSKGRP